MFQPYCSLLCRSSQSNFAPRTSFLTSFLIRTSSSLDLILSESSSSQRAYSREFHVRHTLKGSYPHFILPAFSPALTSSLRTPLAILLCLANLYSTSATRGVIYLLLWFSHGVLFAAHFCEGTSTCLQLESCSLMFILNNHKKEPIDSKYCIGQNKKGSGLSQWNKHISNSVNQPNCVMHEEISPAVWC